jgi:hypothetical protein
LFHGDSCKSSLTILGVTALAPSVTFSCRETITNQSSDVNSLFVTIPQQTISRGGSFFLFLHSLRDALHPLGAAGFFVGDFTQGSPGAGNSGLLCVTTLW